MENKKIRYAIPPLITILIVLFIFLIKHIYPFGNYTICTIDMPIGYVPAFTQLWDILHGQGNIFYNFYLGAGSNIFGSLISNGFINPLSWIVGIFQRENIAGAMSILLIIKMALMTLISYIAFEKLFTKLDQKWKTIAALLYTFNGYTLLMYSNIGWFDHLILFPLIVLSLKEIVDKGKCFWYIILLTINLMISFYVSWFILLIIIFGEFIILYTKVEKERRKEIATKILVSTIISIGLSFVVFFPALMQSLKSYRIAAGTAKASISQFLEFKLLHVIFSGTLIYYNVKFFLNSKDDKKGRILYGCLLFLTLIPIFIDYIDQMWHTGSYFNFPYRYGFITIFIMICTMLHYLENRKESLKTPDKTKNILCIIGILVIGLIAIIIRLCFIKDTFIGNFGLGIGEKELYNLIVIYAGIEGLIAFCTGYLKDNLKKNITLGIIILQIIITCFIFIESKEYSKLKTEEDNNAFNVYKVTENLNIEKDSTLYKFKDQSRLLMINYPYIAKVPAMSTWLHIISSEQRLAAEKLGYSTYKTVIYDQGGTLASDIILASKYTITKENLDAEIYSELEKSNDLQLYDLKIKNNFTKIYPRENDICSIIEKDENTFEIQNNIIKQILNTKEDIFEIEENKEKENTENNGIIEYDLNIAEKRNVYIYVEKYSENSYIKKIFVNEKEINILMQGGQKSDKYPSGEGTNGILDLGTFENENVKIKLELSDNITEETLNSIKIAKLNINKLKELTEQNYFEEKTEFDGNKLKIAVNAKDNKSNLFVPVTFDNGWKCLVNGKEVKIERALDMFMSIPLEEGENNIEFVFVPPYLYFAIKVSAIFWGIFVVFELIKRKIKTIKIANVFYAIGLYIYIAIFIAFLFIIYIKPLLPF